MSSTSDQRESIERLVANARDARVPYPPQSDMGMIIWLLDALKAAEAERNQWHVLFTQADQTGYDQGPNGGCGLPERPAKGPMDPNATLAELRELCALYDSKSLHDNSDQAEMLADIVEHVTALDGWLSRGGFLPDGWAQPSD